MPKTALHSLAPRLQLGLACAGLRVGFTGDGTGLLDGMSEKMVLSRIMQASQIVRNCNRYPAPFRTLFHNYNSAILSYGASLLPYLSLVLHCSVFKVRVVPKSIPHRRKLVFDDGDGGRV